MNIKPCASRIIPTIIIVKMVRTLHMRNTIFKRFAILTLIELTMIKNTKTENLNLKKKKKLG